MLNALARHHRIPRMITPVSGGGGGGLTPTLIFQDAFTQSPTVLLSAHTPTPTGTSWTLEDQSGADTMDADVSGYALITTTGSTLGAVYSCQPDPGVVNVDIQFTLTAIDNTNNRRVVRAFARWADVNNWYALQIMPDALVGVDSLQIVKCVAGVQTTIATFDHPWAINDVVKLVVRDSEKTAYVNGVAKCTSADNSITAAGKNCLGVGRLSTEAQNAAIRAWHIDDFTVTKYT